MEVYQGWELAQWVDEIPGLGPISAVSILARIGPAERFGRVDDLIAFAGLAPGVLQSDGTIHHGRLGGGGTDKHLRFYLVEASMWARRIPRYAQLYERTRRKRGKKIARLTVARHLLRSLFKMMRDRVRFCRLAQGQAASIGKVGPQNSGGARRPPGPPALSAAPADSPERKGRAMSK